MSAPLHSSHALNRHKLIARYVRYFNDLVRETGTDAAPIDPETPAVAAVMLAQLQRADQAMWRAAKEHMKESRHPSIEAQREVINHYAERAGNHDARVIEGERELTKEEGVLEDGRAYRVDARSDSKGWGWSLYIDGRFVRSGWTGSPAPQPAFEAAKKLATDMPHLVPGGGL